MAFRVVLNPFSVSYCPFAVVFLIEYLSFLFLFPFFSLYHQCTLFGIDLTHTKEKRITLFMTNPLN